MYICVRIRVCMCMSQSIPYCGNILWCSVSQVIYCESIFTDFACACFFHDFFACLNFRSSYFHKASMRAKKLHHAIFAMQ